MAARGPYDRRPPSATQPAASTEGTASITASVPTSTSASPSSSLATSAPRNPSEGATGIGRGGGRGIGAPPAGSRTRSTSVKVTPAASQGMATYPGTQPGTALSRSTQDPGSSLGGLSERSPAYRFRYAGALEPYSGNKLVGRPLSSVAKVDGRPTPPFDQKPRKDGPGHPEATAMDRLPRARSMELKAAAFGWGSPAYRGAHGADNPIPASRQRPRGDGATFTKAASPEVGQYHKMLSNREPYVAPPSPALVNPGRPSNAPQYPDPTTAKPNHRQRTLPGAGKIPANISTQSLIK
jgi:hypothetical protein